MASASKHTSLPRTGVASIRDTFAPLLQLLGFWVAIIAPFVILGFIIAGVAVENPGLMGGVLVANVVGIVVGKEHGQ